MPFPIEMDGSAEFRFESLFAALLVCGYFLAAFRKIGLGVGMAAIGAVPTMQAATLPSSFQIDFGKDILAV